jgi:D-alanine-D-alanine ligase
VPYTGPDPRSIRLGSSRRFLKETCVALGIGTPAHAFVEGDSPLPTTLRYPRFVKPPNGYASLGIERASRVADAGALASQYERMRERFGGALVEEFIEGREFTVMAVEPLSMGAEPEVFRPIEVRFPAGESFKHFDLKWVDFEQMRTVPVTDPEIDRRLRETLRRFFLAMDASGYCRADLRMNREGELFLLDFNTMPGVFYPPGLYGCADSIVAEEPGGHRRFLTNLLECAVERAALRSRPRSPRREA